MTPERWGQLEELYQAAQGLPPSERAALLERVDPELRLAVASILAQEGIRGNGDAPDESGAFLDRPAWENRETVLLNTFRGRTAVGVGEQLGPYRIEQEIGQGGMGTVYRATDTRLNRPVAIKISKILYGDRLGREARAIASLNHPHICTLYDTGPDFIVMELVEGETMAAQIRKGALPVRDVLRYGAQIAGALAAAHDKKITHRDLKPANVMITKNGAKVLDFGLARSATHDVNLTMTGAVIGTPAYMAPEQLKGKVADERTDIFALGLTLYEMATGKHVGPGGALAIVGLPDGFVHIVERCLEPEPENRWQSARDVKAELEWAAIGAAAVKHPGGASRVWPAIAGVSILLLFTLALIHFRETAPKQAVVHSTILPPDTTSFAFATNLGPMSLSPSGKRMVFAATGQDGTSQLWIRSLDSATAQRLPGTDGGAFPFWSPDGLWVAFFADEKLKKIDTRGGSPVALAEVSASTGYGGSWSAKGEIVYAPGAFTPLRKVSQDGGKTRSAVDHTGGNGFPWFLPDGEHFLFAAWAGSGHVIIRVGSLSSTNSTAIGEADSNATYASGRLLYLKGSSLMAQPFDLNSLRMSGEAEPVAEGVERFLDLVTFGAFTASNSGLLAYQTGLAEARKQLTWFDRTGKRMATLGDPRAFFSIELSPDGRTLVASAPDSLGNYDLWLYDVAAGGLPTRFTSDSGGEFYGVWSPDGLSIILNTTRKGHYDLFRRPANGASTEEVLYTDDTDKVPTSWSPDGKNLLYFTGGGPRHEIFVLPLTPDRQREPLKPKPFLKTGFNESFGQFSPDGGWVAYNSDLSGQNEVYVTPFSRPSERRRVSTNGGERPRWRRDGKELYYIALDGKLMVADTRIGETNIEAGPPHALVNITVASSSSSTGHSYDISADGQRILRSMPIGDKAIQPVTLVQNFTGALKK